MSAPRSLSYKWPSANNKIVVGGGLRVGHWGGGYMYGPAAQNFFLDFKLCVTRQIRSHRSVGLPLISGPVSMREPGRFQGKAI